MPEASAYTVYRSRSTPTGLQYQNDDQRRGRPPANDYDDDEDSRRHGCARSTEQRRHTTVTRRWVARARLQANASGMEIEELYPRPRSTARFQAARSRVRHVRDVISRALLFLSSGRSREYFEILALACQKGCHAHLAEKKNKKARRLFVIGGQGQHESRRR